MTPKQRWAAEKADHAAAMATKGLLVCYKECPACVKADRWQWCAECFTRCCDHSTAPGHPKRWELPAGTPTMGFVQAIKTWDMKSRRRPACRPRSKGVRADDRNNGCWVGGVPLQGLRAVVQGAGVLPAQVVPLLR